MKGNKATRARISGKNSYKLTPKYFIYRNNRKQIINLCIMLKEIKYKLKNICRKQNYIKKTDLAD